MVPAVLAKVTADLRKGDDSSTAMGLVPAFYLPPHQAFNPELLPVDVLVRADFEVERADAPGVLRALLVARPTQDVPARKQTGLREHESASAAHPGLRRRLDEKQRPEVEFLRDAVQRVLLPQAGVKRFAIVVFAVRARLYVNLAVGINEGSPCPRHSCS